MKRFRFTDRGVIAIKPRDQRFILWELNGFGLRVSPVGGKTWIYGYKQLGRARMMSLGKFPAMGVAAARAAHGKAILQRAQGLDPAALNVEGRRSERSAPTFKALVGEYLDRHARPNKRSWAEDKRILDRYVIPEWGTRKAKDIRRRDVIALTDALVARGVPIMANRVFSVIRHTFNWGISRDLLEWTPCAQISAPAPARRRDRVLDPVELKALVVALEAAKPAEVAIPIRLALMLQLATGQRSGEVCGARWSEFDLVGAWWTIPGDRAKNGLPHRVPLSSLARGVLEDARRTLPDSEFVFPALRGATGSIMPGSMAHVVSRLREKWGIKEHFCPHDVRRSVATGLAILGHSRLVIGRILNHAESSVTAIYDRATYDREKRAALESWGRHLEEIVAGAEADTEAARA